MKVKLGPIALVYNGSGTFVEKDEAAHRLVIDAKGKDKRGNGTAGAMVTAVMSEVGPGSTEVAVTTDLSITGKAAQFGRGNVIKDVSDKLLGQFVSCLEQQLVANGAPDAPLGEESAPAPPPGDATTPRGRRPAPPSRWFLRSRRSSPLLLPTYRRRRRPRGASPVRRRHRPRRHGAARAAAGLLEARGGRPAGAGRGHLPARPRLTARRCANGPRVRSPGRRLPTVKRLAVGMLGLAVLAVAVLLPAWLFNVGSAGDVAEPTTISSYRATFDVADDGAMRVVETIELGVRTFDRHGIFRFFDRADQSAPHLRREPYDIEVLRAGQPEQVEYLTEDQGRFLVAKIGDPDVVLEPGTHTYQISYTIDDVLIDDPGGDGSRFYWQVIPGGWAQHIDEFRAIVRLPADAADVKCALGAVATVPCPPSGEGSRVLRVGLTTIDPFTPVTLQTDLAAPVPPIQGEEYAWGPQYDPVLAPVPVVVLVVLAALGALAAGVALSYRVFERTPSFPLQYAPPPGIGPAQATYVLDERVGREQFVATVLHAAEQGAIDVRRSESGWTIQDRARGTGSTRCPPGSRRSRAGPGCSPPRPAGSTPASGSRSSCRSSRTRPPSGRGARDWSCAAPSVGWAGCSCWSCSARPSRSGCSRCSGCRCWRSSPGSSRSAPSGC